MIRLLKRRDVIAVLAIALIAGSFAIPAFNGYVERSRVARAVSDIGTVSLKLHQWQRSGRTLPQTLAEAGITAVDPWGRPYVYLRAADAKHRLAYTLTRAALLDVERQRPKDAIARATEALGYAEALSRATEIVLAHAVLARARQAVADAAGYATHIAALKSLEQAPVARWARDKALALATESAEAR